MKKNLFVLLMLLSILVVAFGSTFLYVKVNNENSNGEQLLVMTSCNPVYIATLNAYVTPTGAGEITVALENKGVILNSATFMGVAGIGENVAFSFPVSVLKSCECVDNHADLKISVSADATVNANLMVSRKVY